MKVLLEGASCAGKDTLAKELCKSFGYIRCPVPEALLRVRAEVHARMDPQELYKFYVGVVAAQSILLQECETDNPAKHIVLVRYWPSLLAYHSVLGVSVNKLDCGSLCEPDVIFHLEAHPVRLRSRRKLREFYQPLDPLDRYMNSRDKALERTFTHEVYNHYPARVLVRLSTSHDSVEESALQIQKCVDVLQMSSAA